MTSVIEQCLQHKIGSLESISSLKDQWSNVSSWPSSKEEIWRYAMLNWLNDAWELVDIKGSSKPVKAYLDPYDLNLGETDLVLMQGQFLPRDIPGVKYFSQKQLDVKNIRWTADFFNQLGWLGLHDWADIRVESGKHYDGHLHCIMDQAQGWQNIKLNIHVAKDANLRLKLNLMTPDAVTNLSIKVLVEAGGRCELVSWSSPETHLILDQTVDLDDHAEYQYDAMNFESAWCHERIHINVGEKASADLSGLLLPARRQQDHKAIYVKHKKPGGRSRQKFYSVADDQGQAVFHGRAIVEQTAPKTDARQLARALMLSKQCQIFSRPELEIDIDDVQCQHGSSIGELDQQALFYLRSRGLTFDQAKSMLINGFINEIILALGVSNRSWIKKRVDTHAIGIAK